MADTLRFLYIGGPTTLIEAGGLRFLTDPTFDAPGGDYTTGPVTLHKTAGPARPAEELGAVDVVLLSHDHHFDNLDRAGHDVLAGAGQVLTTKAGAARLGGNAVGLEAWETVEVRSGEGVVKITATPARHGPVNGDRGPVVGFVLELPGGRTVYVSGDTVWYEGTQAVAERYRVDAAVLFLGAARVAVVGPDHLTMTAAEAVEAARAFGGAAIVPVHFEGWAHFSESRPEIEQAFAAAGLGERLRWLEPGGVTVVSL